MAGKPRPRSRPTASDCCSPKSPWIATSSNCRWMAPRRAPCWPPACRSSRPPGRRPAISSPTSRGAMAPTNYGCAAPKGIGTVRWSRPKNFRRSKRCSARSFRPDGSRIAYTADAGGRRPTPEPGHFPRRRRHPDHHRGWLRAHLVARRHPDRLPVDQTRRLDSRSPPSRWARTGRRTKFGLPGLNAPEWSPSGKWIAVSTFMGVTLVSPDGKDMQHAAGAQ